MSIDEDVRDAINRGAVARVSDWLRAGGAVDARDAKGRTLLMLAATQGRSAVLEVIIAARATVDAQQSLGMTALMFACFTGEARIAMQLLLAGADPKAQDTRKLNASNYASLKKHSLLVAILDQHGQLPIRPPSLVAAAKLALQAKPPPHLPLQVLEAIALNDLPAVCSAMGFPLAEAGCQPATNSSVADAPSTPIAAVRPTPADAAASARPVASSASPEQHPVEACDGFLGGTALLHAAAVGHTHMVEALLARGAPVDAVDKLGWTPLASACAAGHVVAAEMLLRAGALPDVPDRYGVTALMHAAVSGRNELVRLLLKAAASRYARGPARVTPLLLAEKQGHASTAALMKDRRATHPMTREGSASVLGLMSRVGSLSDFEVREERAAAVAFSLLADEAEATRLEEAARQAKKARKARRKDKTRARAHTTDGDASSAETDDAADVPRSHARHAALSPQAHTPLDVLVPATSLLQPEASAASTSTIERLSLLSLLPELSTTTETSGISALYATDSDVAQDELSACEDSSDLRQMGNALATVRFADPTDATFAARSTLQATEPAAAEPAAAEPAAAEPAAVTATGIAARTGGAVAAPWWLHHVRAPLIEVPTNHLCPITHQMMVDPVITADGTTYDRSAIEAWFAMQTRRGEAATSPLTGEPLANNHLLPNLIVRSLVREFAEAYAHQLSECREYLEQVRVGAPARKGSTPC